MAKILITGANGLVGAEIYKHLGKNGHDVLGTVRQTCPEDKGKITVDLSKSGLDLTTYFQDIDAVVHTAAVVPNRKSIQNDEINKQKTITIDQNVARFCEKKDIPVIYISGCALYDLSQSHLKNENDILQFTSPYIEAKYRGEIRFSKMRKAIIARVSGPYGENLSDEAVLKIFLTKAYKNEILPIFGTGKREQDFIHVKDIARFTEKALFSGQHGAFNVASGVPITMNDLANLCIGICGSGQIEKKPSDNQNDRYYPRFSIQKAQKLLNWQPQTLLKEGLNHIVEHWRHDKN